MFSRQSVFAPTIPFHTVEACFLYKENKGNLSEGMSSPMSFLHSCK